MACIRKGCFSVHFPVRNWVLVIMLRMITNISFGITMPSMHQFITTPTAGQLNVAVVERNASNETSSGSDHNVPVPGFGASEAVYMWAVAMYSFGELAGAFAAPTLIRLLSFRYAIFLGAVTSPLGFLFYSGAPSAWFILIARFFIGANCGLLVTMVPAYISETSTYVYLKLKELEAQKQETCSPNVKMEVDENSEENPVKDRILSVYIFALSSSYIITQAINSVSSQITWINPYRFPGWFVIAFSAVVLTAYLFLFKLYKPEKALNCQSILPCGKRALCIPCAHIPCTLHSGKLTTPSKSGGIYCSQVFIFIFTLILAYSGGSGYGLQDTLLNPILSDHFGFRVKDEIYALLAVSFFQLMGGILNTILMTFKLNMRQMLIFWMTVIIISVTLMADWQSIGHDPCREGFSVNNSMAVQPHRDEYISVEGGGQVCKSLSTSGNECFWNPNSRVTGEYCAECFKVCRSVGKSLNFIQFSVGLALFSMTLVPFQLGTIFLTSDVVPLKYQGTAFGMVSIANALSRMAIPLWSDTVYVASGKHSYPPMGIVALHIATVLVVFLMLYKYMGPIAQEEEEQEEAGVELGPVRPVGGEYKLVSQEEEDLSSEAEGEKEDGVTLLHTSGTNALYRNSSITMV